VARERDLRHLTSEKIQEFLDRGLTPREEALVREHLSACPECRGELEAWSLLFSELGSLPELTPSPLLSREVLARVTVRQPLRERLVGWLGAREGRAPLSGHLPAEGLQDYLDGALSGRRSAGAAGHLAACDVCRKELKGWERLFGSMAALGRFAPAAGFAERVMARVRVPAPAPALWAEAGRRVVGWARGFLPRTRRGWAIAGGIASAPTITMSALLFLVFSHPLLTVGSFTTYASWKASALLGSLFSALASATVESVALFRAYSLLETLARSPILVGVGGLVFSLMSAIALWVLYRNLLATSSSVESHYARSRV
jgi:anti-sigma factor RsiW